MAEPGKEMRTGTTTLGLVCKDGVVLAAERRATMGTLIGHKVTKKIFRLDENLGITTAGLVGDLQALTRYITAEVELYRLKRRVAMPVQACSTLTANILSGRRFFPYLVQLIIGGVDVKGNHVYSIDLAGGSIPDTYVTTGSGSPFVFGVLEDRYKEDSSMDDSLDLAVRSVTAAMKRDAASGNGIDVVKITSEGYFEISDEEIEKRKQKMKLS
ncbi:MAG: archaeal proteasome endopeptidase complex subunit beta [Thermoplasmata archaeon]